MARIRRAEGAAGIYHIMARGINRQSKFVEVEDYFIDSFA